MAARITGLVTLLCVALAACGRGSDEPAERATADTVAAPPQEPPLSDHQALDVLMAMSAAGVEATGGVPETGVAPEVRRYLGVVRADHQALQAELTVIADSLQLSPEPHPVAGRIRAAAQDTRTLLEQQPEGAADRTVLEQQSRLHTLFLGALDSAVLRGSRQQLLAQYAAAVRPLVSAHLQRARQLEQLLRERPVPARPAAASRPATVDTAPRPRPAALDTGRRPPPDTVPSI